MPVVLALTLVRIIQQAVAAVLVAWVVTALLAVQMVAVDPDANGPRVLEPIMVAAAAAELIRLARMLLVLVVQEVVPLVLLTMQPRITVRPILAVAVVVQVIMEVAVLAAPAS